MSTVLADGKMIHRQGDHWMFHKTHDGFMTTGSPTVMVGGKPAARVGDLINCGSKAMQGSPTVMID
jgi:uncharacterized Zn-binding protein involved in type VI secretion